MRSLYNLDRRRFLLLASGGAASACAGGMDDAAGRQEVRADAAPSPDTRSDIDALLDEAAASFGTVGYSVAVLRRRELVYERHAGVGDLDAGTPIGPGSVYPIFSVSKLFLIVALFDAAERGRIDLDASIAAVRADLPEAWHPVTLRQAISHVSGLPEYLNDLNAIPPTAEAALDAIRAEPLRFAPDTRSDYNQTNFLLAREALERACRRTLPDLAARQFDRAGMARTSYHGIAAPARNLVTSYRPTPDRSGPPAVFEVPAWPAYTFGSSGAVTTLGDMVRWTRSLLNGDFVALPALHRSWQPRRLRSGAAARHTNGWEYESHGDMTVVGHAGGDRVVWRHFFRTADPEDSLTVIYLDNGGRTFLRPERLASLLADRIMPGAARPSAALEEALFQRMAAGRWDEALRRIDREADGPLAGRLESILNRVGYDALFALGARAALLAFRSNVDRFPASSNAHDSLGEAQRVSGDLIAARASYARALALDPGNARIRAILEELDAGIAASRGETR